MDKTSDNAAQSNGARAGRKWVKGLAPDAPAGKAARIVVGERLRRPAALLAAAATTGDKDPEQVHQLRVATRRAQAAIDAFRPLLDPKAARKARKAMQRIRREAGPARVCDVHTALFGARVQAAAASRCAAIGFILGRVAAERDAAQRAVVRAAEEWTEERLKRLRKKALAKGRPSADEETFGAFGERAIEEARRRLQSASGANLRSYDNLHALRKSAKAMRYTLEIFRDCMDPAEFNAHYERTTTVQRRLGDLNDAHEMLERVDGALRAGGAPAQLAPALESLRGQMERERALACDRFLQWWATESRPDTPTRLIEAKVGGTA